MSVRMQPATCKPRGAVQATLPARDNIIPRCDRVRTRQTPHAARHSAVPVRFTRPKALRLFCVANETKPTFRDANFPMDAEGRVYHLGVKRGEVANRILSVGDSKRAALLAEMLEGCGPEGEVFRVESSRGFVIYTGRLEGRPVSICATGMGTPMMDFVVRETRAVVDGQMAIARLGTCGLVDGDAAVGTVVLASEGSVLVRREPNGFDAHGLVVPGSLPYSISEPVPADPTLSAAAEEVLREQLTAIGRPFRTGLNATADSFYSSQGRVGSVFGDSNEGLLDELLARQPRVISLEMETFHLMDLARCSGGSIRAAAAAIGLAQRKSNEFIESRHIKELEVAGGRAMLLALVRCPLPEDANGGCLDQDRCVW